MGTEKTRDAAGQQRIDFNLGAAFRAVEALQLSGTATAVFKAILACGANSFPSVPELARRTGFSDRTIQRAVHRLRERGLIRVHQRLRPNGSHSSNRFEATASIFDPLPGPDIGNGAAGGGDRVGGGGDRVSPGGVRLSPGVVSGCHPPINPFSKPKYKSHGHGDDGILKKDHDGNRPAAAASPAIDWRRVITAADLRSLDTVEELFGIAVGELPAIWRNLELDRIAFFGLAIVAREKNNPGGWFNRAVAGKWTSFVRGPVEDRARQAVKIVLYGPESARPVSAKEE